MQHVHHLTGEPQTASWPSVNQIPSYHYAPLKLGDKCMEAAATLFSAGSVSVTFEECVCILTAHNAGTLHTDCADVLSDLIASQGSCKPIDVKALVLVQTNCSQVLCSG